eukprot:COSAG02_NODE_3784_length_6235_cov_2.509289_2_plen_52_part_00
MDAWIRGARGGSRMAHHLLCACVVRAGMQTYACTHAREAPFNFRLLRLVQS